MLKLSFHHLSWTLNHRLKVNFSAPTVVVWHLFVIPVVDPPGSALGCAMRVTEGAVPNEHGTWLYGRGGWCDGLQVSPWRTDITEQVCHHDTSPTVHMLGVRLKWEWRTIIRIKEHFIILTRETLDVIMTCLSYVQLVSWVCSLDCLETIDVLRHELWKVSWKFGTGILLSLSFTYEEAAGDPPGWTVVFPHAAQLQCMLLRSFK